MQNSFVHKDFTVSMSAVRNDVDPERVRFDVTVAVEDISTGQFLLNETRPTEALEPWIKNKSPRSAR
jgi:hypothetical protein